MLGGKNKQPLGYTIVEVMIVLAVSGAMFVIAASFINGKQQKTAFETSINELASKIQNVIGQVSEGHYSDVPISCTSDSSGVPTITTGGAAGLQGQQFGCVFLGKVIFFTNRNTMYNISLAGSRLNSSSEIATTLPESNVTYIPSLTTEQSIPNNLRVLAVSFSGGPPRFSVGFIQTQGQKDVSGNLKSGSQDINIYSVQTHNTNTQSQNGVESSINHNTLNIRSSANLCVTDGAYYAQIFIGDTGTNASQLNVDVRMLGRSNVPLC